LKIEKNILLESVSYFVREVIHCWSTFEVFLGSMPPLCLTMWWDVPTVHYFSGEKLTMLFAVKNYHRCTADNLNMC